MYIYIQKKRERETKEETLLTIDHKLLVTGGDMGRGMG